MSFNEKSWAKEIESRGFVYDFKKANHAVDFIQSLTYSIGKMAGQRVKLLEWENEIVRKVCGSLKPNGNRKFKKVYIQIAKKQGKTELCGWLAAYFLYADGEQGARVYCAAADKEQATMVFDVAAQAVRNNVVLSGNDKSGSAVSKIIDSRKRIVFYKTASYIQVLSSDVKTKHGLNPSAVIIDELHAHQNRNLYDVLTVGASAARKQPILFIITTAGYDRESICYEEYTKACKIRDGIIEDEEYLPIIYEMDKDDDWEDETNWGKANPSLGITTTIEEMRAEFKDAKEIPARQNTFRQLRLNQWTQQANRFIEMGLWKEQAERLGDDYLDGRKCFAGLDLSTVKDFSAEILVFPRDECQDEIDVLCRFWCPESRLTASDNKYREQYQSWAHQGYLTVTPGNSIDYGAIEAQVVKDSLDYDMYGINVDALFQGHQMVTHFMDLLGEDKATVMRQGFISYGMPMKAFERRLINRQIHHGNNPVLNFCADNLAVDMDAAGNLKPSKAQSQGKIDGIVALVMALDLANATKKQKPMITLRGV